MVEQQGEEGAIAQGLQIVAGGELQEVPRLRIPERRRLALVAFDLGPFHALDRIRRHRILIAEVFKQGGEGGQLAPDRRAGELAPLEVLAPGEDMRAGDEPQFRRRGDADEGHELLQVIAVRAARVGIVDVRKPLGRRRHLGELVKFRRRQRARARRRRRSASGQGRGQLGDRAHGFGP